MRYLIALSAPAFMLVAGCSSTMNKDQCLVADWRTVGYEDGSAGRSEQWLARRGDACAKHGVAPELDAYLAGRDDGLRVFCKPRRAFDLGRRGTNYGHVCPADLESAFLAAYDDGRGLYDRQRRYNEIDNAIANAIAELDNLKANITDSTLTLATGEMTPVERAELAVDIKEMAEERGRIKANLPAMEADLADARYDLDSYRESIATRYPGISSVGSHQ